MAQLKKVVSAAIAAALFLCLFMGQALASSASPSSFETDLDGIDRAAQSVLMLDIYDANDELIATGSGFVAFDNYTLVTNCHVIEGADYILANSDAGYQYLVTKVIAADKEKDIAILEFFSPTDLTPLTLDATTELRRAEPVVAIGSPKGVTNTVSLGNISAMYKDGNVNYIQFTAPISHGSSGGALFSSQGSVIGVTSAYYQDGQNMNVAIDIGEVMALYERESGNQRVELSGYSAPAASAPEPTVTPTEEPASVLPVVTDVQVIATEKGVDITWASVPQAQQYNVYRSASIDGAYTLVAMVEESLYHDADFAPGKTCFYKIRSVNGANMSDPSAPVEAGLPGDPAATPYLEPVYPIQVGDYGSLELYEGYPSFAPDVVNVSKTKTVDSFTLTFYCEDAQHLSIQRDGHGAYTVSFDFTATVVPGQTVRPEKSWLQGYADTKYVFVAITKFHTTDGNTVIVPEKEWNFWNWSFE